MLIKRYNYLVFNILYVHTLFCICMYIQIKISIFVFINRNSNVCIIFMNCKYLYVNCKCQYISKVIWALKFNFSNYKIY